MSRTVRGGAGDDRSGARGAHPGRPAGEVPGFPCIPSRQTVIWRQDTLVSVLPSGRTACPRAEEGGHATRHARPEIEAGRGSAPLAGEMTVAQTTDNARVAACRPSGRQGAPLSGRGQRSSLQRPGGHSGGYPRSPRFHRTSQSSEGGRSSRDRVCAAHRSADRTEFERRSTAAVRRAGPRRRRFPWPGIRECPAAARPVARRSVLRATGASSGRAVGGRRDRSGLSESVRRTPGSP